MKKIKFQLLREGLGKHDLVELVDSTFTIDKFKPKFGEEKDIIVTAFKCASESKKKDFIKYPCKIQKQALVLILTVNG